MELDKGGEGHGQLQGRWTHHPLALMYLASAARERFVDIEFRILHTATCDDFPTEVTAVLDTFQPDVVGLRSLSIFQEQFKQTANLIRERLADVTLIGGGPYSSGSYKQILENKLVDIVVINEGEETFTNLIAELKQETPSITNLAGIAILDAEGKCLKNPDAMPITDLDSLPFPAYDLINPKDYEGLSNQSFQSASKSAFIYSTRGCPYRCFYCSAALTKKVRKRSPENVVLEMEKHYYERGVRDFVFVDDIFNVPISASKKTLSLIAHRLPDVKLNFSNGLRADQIDEEFLDLLQEVGACHISLAVETAVPRLQKMIGKFLNLDKTHDVIQEATQRFVVCCYFMVGFPTETFDEALSTVRYAQAFPSLAHPVLSIVRIYQGTPLFDFLEPTEEQLAKLDKQASSALQPSLWGEIPFYGDLFPDDKVPLSGKMMNEIRVDWSRNVILNEERIHNSHKILEKHYDKEQRLSFYRNFFDQPHYSNEQLELFLRLK
ncbi:MAG: B12-binding domain-containing radical SAM protein [Magnetococcales bacterium]|nr:B12-binding domain-containing radical SAM protein [Magnetococcales bacterium]